MNHDDLIAKCEEGSALLMREGITTPNNPSLYREAAAALRDLVRERDEFYMDYRMKCDVETKRLHVENERLQERLEAAEALFKKHFGHFGSAAACEVDAFLYPQCAARAGECAECDGAGFFKFGADHDRAGQPCAACGATGRVAAREGGK